jgi:hypothetical protein
MYQWRDARTGVVCAVADGNKPSDSRWLAECDATTLDGFDERMVYRRVKRWEMQAAKILLDYWGMFAEPGVLHRPVMNEVLKLLTHLLRGLRWQELKVKVDHGHVGRYRRVPHNIR